MAICKCKMCGGDLNITELDKVVECEYCGTTQTVPSADNEKKMTLFNRANRLRLNNEFDKAAALYEQLVAEFPEEAEAYWGLCLCNYGIEYVDDPATGEKKPTCHRASFEKLSDDENFNLAMEYADVIAQRQYRAEAREIDRINEEILSVSRNETPYDIFICYKETDENGGRTPDSVMAQDIYDALTAKGYKVFFARISLEDKLGQQYEPYIFAALNSAKIMLSVGTKYEYFHAVWVKNEWSRFLRLAAKDKSKALIPCYKDMDPYDMPDEFKGLQAQDLGKLGAMQDLVRGVEKLLPKDAPAQPAAPAQVVVANSAAATTESLLKRAFMFLEDSNWQSADEYAEKVLDIDPENAEAYLAKGMAEIQAECRSCMAKKLAYNATKITLVSVDPAQKGKVIRTIQDITGMGPDEAKEFTERTLPAETTMNCTPEELNELLDSVAADKRAVIKIGTKTTVAETSRLQVEFTDSLNKALRFGSPSLASELEAVEQEAQSLFEQRIAALRAEAEQRRIEEEERRKKEEEQRASLISQISAKREQLLPVQNLIATGAWFTVGLRSDGTVLATGHNDKGQCNTEDWRSIVAITAGPNHTVGLREDGTVLATGNNDKGQCKTKDWRNVVAIAAGSDYTVGLREDGTVLATGRNDKGQCNTEDWRNVVAIAAGFNHTVGLREDGTVLATGHNDKGQCNTAEWKNVVAIAAASGHTVGLREDGTVLATGNNFDGECNTQRFSNIVAISAKSRYTAGLRDDGTVMRAGIHNAGVWAVERWNNIVAISIGYDHIVGLREDGTVLAAGDVNEGQCYTGNWRDVVAIAACGNRTYGLCRDGTVLAAGENQYGASDIGDWKLFDSIETAEAEFSSMKKRAEEERIAAEQRAEEIRLAHIDKLSKEKAALEAELPTLTGFFKSGRRKEVEARLAVIKFELKKLQS